MSSAAPHPSPSLSLGAPRFNERMTREADSAHGAHDDLARWLDLFSRHGVKAPSLVAGDFAVGLSLPDGRTFLAVDRFAIRSLCYRIVEGELRFAERADQLADPQAEIDPQAIFDYLYFHVIPSPRTIFSGVQRLPPGHYALYESGRLTVAPYWTPHFEENRRTSFDDLRSEFHQLLHDAVASQLGAGKTACFLSGGTDSSTVAGILSKVSGEPAASYSIGFDAEGYDEMEYARIAARHFKTEHHEYYVTPDDLVRSIPRVAAHYDQPFGNSSSLPAFYCAQMAKADGIDKMLAGDGGDELFGGNTRYAKQRIFDWYNLIPAPARSGLMEPVLAATPIGRLPLLRKAASYVDQARVPMPDRLQTYNLLTRLGLDLILTEEFLARVDLKGPTRQQAEVWQQVQGTSLVNRMLAFDWRYTLAENDLPKVCGTTRLANIQVGFPLLDNQLVDFSMRLPTAYKLKGLKLRWFFKEALRGFLPDEIITKKKQGFGLPFGVWATRHPALHKLAEDSLRSLAERGIVRPNFIDDLLTRHLQEYPGYYGELVWIMMMMEHWMQVHTPTFRLR